MKKHFLPVALLAILAAAAIQWGTSGTAVEKSAPASSQIYIHGTPVCVLSHGNAILATVGMCGPGKGDENPWENSHEAMPFFGSHGTTLPPGHPPVVPDMSSDGPDRIAI